MERIVRIHAMYAVSTILVTDSTAVVCMVVKRRGIVIRVYLYDF